MPSNNQCQKQYLDARKALNNFARSLKACDEQKLIAKMARTKLALGFIGQNISEVKKRTEQFRQFKNVIENTIEKIGNGKNPPALRALKTIAEDSRKLIGE